MICLKDTPLDFFMSNRVRTETTMWKSSLKTFDQVGIFITLNFISHILSKHEMAYDRDPYRDP